MAAAELDKKLEKRLQLQARKFHRTYFERGPENRFSDLDGQEAYTELFKALEDTDEGERIDALLSLGRLFSVYGADGDNIKAVMAHLETVPQGFGPERHAGLFALGSGGDSDFFEGFLPMLSSDNSYATNIALFLFGYGKWTDAVPFIRFIVNQNAKKTAPAAIWALGQIGRGDTLDLLLPMLRSGTNIEWIVGALGDIGDIGALEDLTSHLEHEKVDIRLSAMMSIFAIVGQNKDSKVRREFHWIAAALRKAGKDAFPPVALFALLTLAELGQGVEQEDVMRVFEMEAQNGDASGTSGLYLNRTVN